MWCIGTCSTTVPVFAMTKHRHCPGCNCSVDDYELHDVILIPVAVAIMPHLTKGKYSEPVRIKLERVNGMWEMTLHRQVVAHRHDTFFGSNRYN